APTGRLLHSQAWCSFRWWGLSASGYRLTVETVSATARDDTRYADASRGGELTGPLVPLLLELQRQLRPAGADDPPVYHDVHEVRLHVVQHALIVRDQQHGHVL